MAIIRKAITGLKPGSDYLFTLKPKNVEISATDQEQETIRVSIPEFSGTPSVITGLQLASNFQTVIFKFDPINDADLSYFEYQLYDNEFGTGAPINEVTSTSNNPVSISGTNTANVFLVSVDNSTDTQGAEYWGRVRAVNVAGNPSTEWSELVASGELDLISDTFISSLTAAKITAGTIGAAEITLAGATSIIKSSNYSSGTSGWKITGFGDAEFNDLTVRTSLDIGGNDTTSFHVDIDGNMWLGSGILNFNTAPFRVTNAGALTATGVDISGAVTATSGTFTGTITSGYNLTTQFGNNINGATNYSGFKIGNTGWENAWVQRSDGTIYFRAGTGTKYIQMDTSSGGTSAISFPNFSVDNNGILTASGANIDGTISAFGVELGRDVGPGTGHYGLSLDSGNFNNIFLKRNDGVVFFRVNEGGTNSLTFDSFTGILSVTGTITASSGTIGGFTLSSTSISSSTITINASTNRITIGTPGTDPCIRLDSDLGIFVGDTSFSASPFSVTMQGALKATSGTIGGFTINSSSLTRTGTGSTTRLRVGDECVLTGSSVSAGSISGVIFASTNASTSSAAPIQQVNSGSELRRFTSREEYKYDIADLDEQDKNLIDKLRPRKFKWKWIENYEEPEDSKYLRSQDITFGFIAEEMGAIETEGRIGSFAVYEPYEDSFKPIFWRSYDLISLLVAEVQDLRKRISLLES